MPNKTYPTKRRRTAPKSKDDRTKFDKWLERMRDDGSDVEFHFAIEPFLLAAGISHRCKIIDVDRYMLLLEFSDLVTEDDGMVYWVSKSIITAASSHGE